MLEEEGIKEVELRYDEAISATIFYLEWFFTPPSSSAPRLSRSSVAARGTSGPRTCLSSTSVAGAPIWRWCASSSARRRSTTVDQGAGGRYYVISPKLLGAAATRTWAAT